VPSSQRHRLRHRLTRLPLQHHGLQPRAQRFGIQAALDLPVGNDRDTAGFFRDDDGDGVVFLGETDRRAMT
jgi:hypothetical protein